MPGERTVAVDAFVKKWRDEDDGRVPETEDALQGVEIAHRISLPEAYRYLMLEYGAISTQALMLAVAEGLEAGRTDLPDLVWFLKSSEILEEMESRASEIPDGLVCFATRMNGDLFLFDREECNAGAGKAPSVWLLWADEKEAFQVSESFTGLLEEYLELQTAEASV